MNTTFFDDSISSILYISQVPSTSPIADHFSMYNRHNIYLVAVVNKDPNLSTIDVQLLTDKKKRSRYSSVKITLSLRCPSALTSLKEHRAFFDQGRTILEPAINH